MINDNDLKLDDMQNIKKSIESMEKNMSIFFEDLKNKIEDCKQKIAINEEIKNVKLRNDNENILSKFKNRQHKFIEELYSDVSENTEDKYEKEVFILLKRELDLLKMQPKFKIKEISKFIKNLNLGDFNKQKFNRLIREKVIPQAEEKEKNQFLYNKEHIPYAIILQCFSSLDVSDFSKLINFIKNNFNSNSNDIYVISEAYMKNNSKEEEKEDLDNISKFAIDVYISNQVYKNTVLISMKKQFEYSFNELNEELKNKLKSQLDDLEEEDINEVIEYIDRAFIITRLQIYELMTTFFIGLKKVVINDIDSFNNN